MRTLSYLLILVGLSLLCLAGSQQSHGMTDVPVLVGNDAHTSVGAISNAKDPEGFSRAMTFHWLYAGLIVGMGIALLVVVSKQDRLDPLAPNLARESQAKR